MTVKREFSDPEPEEPEPKTKKVRSRQAEQGGETAKRTRKETEREPGRRRSHNAEQKRAREEDRGGTHRRGDRRELEAVAAPVSSRKQQRGKDDRRHRAARQERLELEPATPSAWIEDVDLGLKAADLFRTEMDRSCRRAFVPCALWLCLLQNETPATNPHHTLTNPHHTMNFFIAMECPCSLCSLEQAASTPVVSHVPQRPSAFLDLLAAAGLFSGRESCTRAARLTRYAGWAGCRDGWDKASLTGGEVLTKDTCHPVQGLVGTFEQIAVGEPFG